LLTSYGPVFEVWHDGANGGDGFYGGAREKRTIDKRTYYGWPETWALVRKFQPDAVIFSDVGPDIRWVGNEKGIAGDPCWATFDPVGEDGGPASPGDVRTAESTTGHRHGKLWLPAECDVSIRPGWFWHETENSRVKTAEQLWDLYCQSVGRGASFLLNVPPDRRGLLHENDTQSLRAFGRRLRAAFAANLLAAPALSQDGREWSAHLKTQEGINLIRLREDIREGQRIDRFRVEIHRQGIWHPLTEGTSVGACRIVRLPERARGNQLRLTVLQSSAPPKVSEFTAYWDAG
jgi:alpha-L-fucosidase